MAEKKVRGLARVTFITNLDLIRRELEQGWTAQAIYDRHPELFGGAISYAHFARYAAQVRGGLPISSRRKPKSQPLAPSAQREPDDDLPRPKFPFSRPK